MQLHIAKQLAPLAAAALLALGAGRAAAQDVVPGLRLATAGIRPGTTEFHVALSIPGQPMVQVGTMKEEVRLVEHAGKPALLRVTTFERTGATLVDTAIAVRETLAPLFHRSHQPRQTMTLVFDGRRVRAAVVPRTAPPAQGGEHAEHGGEHAGHGQAQPSQQHAGHAAGAEHAEHAADPALGEAKEFEVPMFDSNAVELVLGALPLAEGWSGTLPLYLHEQGGLVRVAARVQGREAPSWLEGAAPAWKVHLEYPGRPITYWVDPQTRRVIAEEATSARGTLRMTAVQ